MVGRLNNQIDHWLFEEYRVDQADLALFRKVYAVMTVALYFPRAMWASSVPLHFWDSPASLTSLLDGPPAYWVLVSLNGLLLCSCVALFFGLRTPAASLGVGLTLILLDNVHYSFGKIDHDILFPLTAICLAFSGWGGRAPQRPWGLAFLALCLGIAMFTAAWPKALAGWLSNKSLAVKAITTKYQGLPHSVIGGDFSLAYTPDWLWELQDWAAVGLEAGFIFAALRLRWLRATMIVAMLFHATILITLGIPFGVNVIVYAAFFPLSKLRYAILACLPVAMALTLCLCNWKGPQFFLQSTIVMLGGLMALGYLAALPLRRRPIVRMG
jgi:hypothetical protein